MNLTQILREKHLRREMNRRLLKPIVRQVVQDQSLLNIQAAQQVQLRQNACDITTRRAISRTVHTQMFTASSGTVSPSYPTSSIVYPLIISSAITGIVSEEIKQPPPVKPGDTMMAGDQMLIFENACWQPMSDDESDLW